MKPYLRCIIDDNIKNPTPTQLAPKTSKSLSTTLPYPLTETSTNYTPRTNKLVSGSFTSNNNTSNAANNNYHSESLTRSTSKIVLTQRDEDPSNGNGNSSRSGSPQLPIQAEHLREHFKQSFQPISTQSISSLEINLRSTPSNAIASQRPISFDSVTRNHIYISDPLSNNYTSSNNTNITNNNNVPPTTQTPSLASSRNSTKLDANLYSISLPIQAEQQPLSLASKTQSTREQSRRPSTSEDFNIFSRPQIKEDPLTPTSFSSITSNYLANRALRSNTISASTTIGKAVGGASVSTHSLASSPTTSSASRREETTKFQSQRLIENQLVQKQKVDQSKKELIEQSIAEVLTAMTKLQANLQPSIIGNQDQEESEIFKKRLEESQTALRRSEIEKNELKEQLSFFTQKVAQLIGIQTSITAPQPQSLVLNLEEALSSKDRRIAELEQKLKQQSSQQSSNEELEKDVASSFKKQFSNISKIDPYGSSSFGTGVIKPNSSYSLNNSPALRNKYRPTPLGAQATNTPQYYGVGIKENEFPVSSVSTSGGYNVFKAKIDQLNSLRDDRVLTALRK